MRVKHDTDYGSILWGDCIELMREIPDNSIDMVLCDLPYGTTDCKWDTIIPFETLWFEYWRITKPDAAIVLTASQPFTSALIMSQPKRFKYEWIWHKNAGSNFALTKYQPMKEHENICVFGRGKTLYFPIMQERSEIGKKDIGRIVTSKRKSDHHSHLAEANHKRKPLSTLRVPSSVQKFNRERGLHPTQKPVDLFEYLIKTYTREGMVVLDNCSGSGTTAIAAIRSNRKYLCIEKDDMYYLKSIHRIGQELRK